jgi:hypothetical protein
MAVEIEGKLIAKLAVQAGKSGNGEWKKQDFIVETLGDYPKKVCFSVWGDKTDVLKSLSEGSTLKISFEPSSREFNGKWYTDLRAWKIETLGAKQQFSDNDIPPPDYEQIESGSVDDLPF